MYSRIRIHRRPLGLAALLALMASCTGPIATSRDLAIADAALKTGYSESAISIYRTLLDREPRNPRALHGLARSYVAKGDAEASLSIYAALEALAPVYFRRVLPDFLFALDRAAAERSSAGDGIGALRLLERIAESDPEHEGLADRMVALQLELAADHRSAGRSSEAEALYRSALQLRPDRTDSVLGLVDVLVDQARAPDALAVLEEARQRRPEDRGLLRAMDRVSQIR